MVTHREGDYVVKVFVGLPTGIHIMLEVEPSDRIENVRVKIQEITSIPANQQRVFFNGRELMTGNTLQDYGILEYSMLTLEAAPAPPPSYFEYIVQPGDSLWLLARRFGTTEEAIKALNGLTSDLIFIGQTLRIPGEDVTAPPPPLPPDERPTLQIGDSGHAVRELQTLLSFWGYLSHSQIDSVFGPQTQNAVMAFQRDQGLAVDGIVGPSTWDALLDEDVIITPPPPPPSINRPILRIGARGDAVRELQTLLTSWGYRLGSIDGIFGPQTQNAVLAFQRDHGLSADGIVGPITWGALLNGNTAPPPPPPLPPVNRPTLRIGARGEDVMVLQLQLHFWLFLPGPIDGMFGPLTQNAVMAFQRDRRLTVDGIVGPITWTALFSGMPWNA